MKVDTEKLKIAQANRCMTNHDLCRVAKVGHVTLIEIKNGRRKSPTLKTIGKLAKALNVDVADLLEVKN